MHPQSDEVIRLFDRILSGGKDTLEHIGQVSAVELIVEILGSLFEASIDFRVKRKSCLDDWRDFSLDSSLEFGEMPCKICLIND